MMDEAGSGFEVVLQSGIGIELEEALSIQYTSEIKKTKNPGHIRRQINISIEALKSLLNVLIQHRSQKIHQNLCYG